MAANTGYLFYNEYYRSFSRKLWQEIVNSKTVTIDPNLSKVNKDILEAERVNPAPQTLGNYQFKLKTTYPGMLLGAGYHHETGVEGEFKIGFYFDHTTGMPVIPGSSVKGVLRSAFPIRGNKYSDERKNYIKELLKEIIGTEKAKVIDVEVLELEIFEGVKDKDRYLPMSERDIFFDAFPVDLESDGLLSEDFITPHGDNPLKNPIPLKFLKVSPGVTFQFDFDLKDGKILTGLEKRQLFRKILLDFGIGAKTNVGYGQFDEEVAETDEKNEMAKLKQEEEAKRKLTEQKRLAKEKEKRRKEVEEKQRAEQEKALLNKKQRKKLKKKKN